MTNIGFIGWGIVGQATGKGLAKNKKNKIFWFDKYKESPFTLSEVMQKTEFIFLCVPTPMYSDHSGIDSSIIDSVVAEIAPMIFDTQKVLIIKSTVLPGTTAKYAKKYPRANFAMIPEFLTEKRANWDFLHPARTIIGAKDRKVVLRLKRLHQTVLPKNAPYFLTDTTSAELTKYMANIMLAEKIMIANEFYFLAQRLGVEYDGVRQMVEGDKRIGSHIKVPGHDGNFGFGGKCFPKDTVALLGLGKKLNVDLSVMEVIWKKNLRIRKNRDWEEIAGAVNHKNGNGEHVTQMYKNLYRV